MKPSETTAIYVEACRSRRITPQQEEGRLWHKLLASYDAKDVRAGLDAWSANSTLGKDGQPKGKWLPAPVELKPAIEDLIRKRIAAAAVKRFPVRWRCPSCKWRGMGMLAIDEPAGSRRCGACDREAEVENDERPKQCQD
jgi:hypothetical protein